MKKLFDKETSILFTVIFLLFALQIPVFFLLQTGFDGILLYVFLLLLTAVAILTGPVTGLFGSLLFIFIIGTALLYLNIKNLSLPSTLTGLPMPLFLGYGFALLLFVLLAGYIHDRIVQQANTNRRLQEEIRQYVAVDVETGFDNGHRMVLEIQEEMHRADRYGGAFTLLLLKIDFFDDFKRIYGEKETSHFLSALARSVQKLMRSTDKKFRYQPDRFALLLTHTDDQAVDVVYDKLANQLTTHQLLSGKYVTLSFRSGHIVYEKSTPFKDYEDLLEQVESEMISNAL